MSQAAPQQRSRCSVSYPPGARSYAVVRGCLSAAELEHLEEFRLRTQALNPGRETGKGWWAGDDGASASVKSSATRLLLCGGLCCSAGTALAGSGTP